MRKKAPVKKKPASTRIKKRVDVAVDLYRRFREEDPDYIDEVRFDVPDTCMVIGTLDTVEYTTTRGGKVEYYRHEFDQKSKPLLVSSWDGKQCLIIGGRYDFTEVGIKDY